ncbi:MAG TPA: malectin domain-containing carbohydrate-binding protein [Tahibacter sp.]|uniref:malectin domain-containing carbohydrate-binding protein n=1 Tax=Tahibacter sp. TaxID=2056211 RepID=UPI002CBEEEBD|nr:malectin domain-containing carbohydrate-binding protein [Tahibacter sp.]HSX62865.1 malectin domain-containing carbohydrate-binding protein [Tahibacter sp.]
MRGFLVLMALSVAAPAAALTAGDFAYRTVTSDGGNGFALPYRIHVPAACASRRCPLVLFLHGAGETGSNNTAQLNNRANGAFRLAEDAQTLGQPVIMAAPQAPEWWSNENPTGGLADLVDDVQREFGFDPARLYVTGLSMGGGGTIGFLQRYDAVAAAAIPICPAGVVSSTIDRDRLWDTPAWYFHAINDGTVPVDNSRTSVTTLRAGGGDPLYTEFASGDHGIWTETYKVAKLAPWMLAQRWRLPMVATGPRVTLTTPSTALRWYTNAASTATAGTIAADAVPTVVNYVFGALQGTAAGTTSFTTGALAIPPNATTTLRLQATGTSHVANYGGNTTFSRSVRVTHPVPANRAPRAALWVEPVATVGQPLRLRALVDDDAQPQAVPGVTFTLIESPSAAAIEVDAATPALAWFTPAQPGLYRFEMRASDGALETAARASVLVLGAGAPRPALVAINSGGPALTLSTGQPFVADASFTGGATEALTTGVTSLMGTQDDALYRTMRRGNSFSYALSVPNGRYLVVLHFAEWRWFTAVARGIDVALEGAPMLAGFDLYRWAGLRNALRIGDVVTVSDGTLNLAVQKTAGANGEARLDAFEVLSLGAGDVIMRNGFEPPL